MNCNNSSQNYCFTLFIAFFWKHKKNLYLSINVSGASLGWCCWGGGGVVRLSSCGFSSRPGCMMGRATTLSSLYQLTLPITDCLPLIHTPLKQSAQKRVRGKNTLDSFLFNRVALILLFPSTAAHALCLKDENISHKIDCHSVNWIHIDFWLAGWCSYISIWSYVCVFYDNWGTYNVYMNITQGSLNL